MSKFAQWSVKSNDLKKSKEWANNKYKTDSQDGKFYQLKVNQPSHEFFKYCGQAYAGANNYHSAPRELMPYLQRAIKNNGSKLIDEAIRLMSIDNDALAIESESEVNAMLELINKAKSQEL